MATSPTDVKSQTIELSTEAFETFCEDISGMFGIDMECHQQEFCFETVKGLKKRFKKLAAVNSVKSEGTLDGTFQIVFDQEGLFTVAGVIVMLPEQRILDNRKRGSAKDAEDMSDAMGEAVNLLVGSWDRIFREGLDGHGHFVQTSTFIGNPWDNAAEKIGLSSNEESLFIPYEMTIGSYPAFNCGVIFPKTIFGEPKLQQPPADEKALEIEDKAAEQLLETEQETSDESQTKAEEPIAEETVEFEAEPEKTSEPTGGTEPATGPVSGTIQRMAQSSADLPGVACLKSMAMCAKDIMQKEVLWGNADDSVQQALTKMQQADAGYMMVGTDGQLEGMVSKSDIATAVSIYLRPVFAKWRRPIDDATLQIRIKWIMSRSVRTIKPDTSLTAIMENMRQSGLRCLPVVDQQGKVAGLVTVFDIFKTLLHTNSGLSTTGKTPQAPSLV